MTKRLLLDTHVALWLDGGDERLRASTRRLIDSCWQNGGAISSALLRPGKLHYL